MIDRRTNIFARYACPNDFADQEPWLADTPVAPAPNNTAVLDTSNPAEIANASPDTAITNWSSAPVTNWPATPTSYDRREALRAISKRCPKINEDILLLALEEHDFNVDDALDLLTGVGADDAMISFLTKVFPGVPRVTIEIEIAECYGKYFDVFARLVMKFHSYWKPHPDPTTSALSLSPPTRYRPDFSADGFEEEKVEAAWWRTLADTIRWQVQPPVPDNQTWTTIISACYLTSKSYSPRLAGMVRNLAGPDSAKALEGLKVLPAYATMVDLATNAQYRDMCTSIVAVLTSNGMAAPGAVAWAFEKALDSPPELFVLRNAAGTYEKTSSTIWIARNKAMFALREKSFNDNADRVLIDVDADDVRDGLSAKDVPTSPTISRVTRTSAGAKTKTSKAQSPYPAVKPRGRTRASDDDVRAAEYTAKGKRVVHDDIIELTSESDADQESRMTPKHPSPANSADALPSTVDETPKPTIMSPSIVSPKKKTGKKPAPAKRSPVKTRSAKHSYTDLP